MSDSSRLELPMTPRRWALLVFFAAAALGLVALPGAGHGSPFWLGLGLFGWLGCGGLAWCDPERKLRRRMGVLLGCLGVLGICDIQTTIDRANVWQVGVPFFLVVFVPALQQHWGDRGVISFRLWPREWHWRDFVYTGISIPLAWAVLKFYWWCNPDLYTHWALPPAPDPGAIRSLFLAINAVGIWDELFFVNTVFAMLRSLFSYRVANTFQAIVYASVLHDMAFTGAGPLILLIFAWTQGAMFERSESLVCVLLVHLIVDYFLVAAIVGSHYPGFGLDFLWRHGL